MNKLVILAIGTTAAVFLILSQTSGHKNNSIDNKSLFQLHSSAFSNNEFIPQKYTCEGQEVSPPLSWSGAPATTQSFALICQDPDAINDDGSSLVWDHWIVFNLPPTVNQLEESTNIAQLGAQEGIGSGSDNPQRYQGPCPPTGTHRYIFTLYALDIPTLTFASAPSAQTVINAMESHIIAQTELIGLYKKGNK